MIDETLRRKPEFVNSLFEKMTSALDLPPEVKLTAVTYTETPSINT